MDDQLLEKDSVDREHFQMKAKSLVMKMDNYISKYTKNNLILSSFSYMNICYAPDEKKKNTKTHCYTRMVTGSTANNDQASASLDLL